MRGLKHPYLLNVPERLKLDKEWRQNRIDLFQRAAQLDDIVRIQCLGIDRYLVNHPLLVEQICKNADGHFEVTRDDAVMLRVLGDSVFTMKEAEWRNRRRLLAPLYNKAQLEKMTRQIERTLAERLSTRFVHLARSGEPFDLEAECVTLVHAIFAKIMFGGEFDHRLRNLQGSIEAALMYREDLRWRKRTDGHPTADDREFDRICDRFEAALSELIDENRSNGDTAERTLLSELIELSNPSLDNALSEEALLDEAKTFFHASTLSTAAALTWSIFLLLTHPATLSALVQQITAQVPVNRRPVAADLKKIPLSHQITLETLRLYPPSWVTSRRILQHTQVGEYALEGDIDLIFSPYLIHRDARFWDRAGQFDPARFADDESGGALSGRCSYIPFGAGTRQCLGKALSLLELPLILVTLAHQFEVTLTSSETVDVWPLTALKPRTKIMVALSNRHGEVLC